MLGGCDTQRRMFEHFRQVFADIAVLQLLLLLLLLDIFSNIYSPLKLLH
jgi:hypothetical protein